KVAIRTAGLRAYSANPERRAPVVVGPLTSRSMAASLPFPAHAFSNRSGGTERFPAAVPIPSEAVEAKHDVLVIGAGCAGMRAAIEAHDAGADVALVSKIHPVRSHSGAAEGGINAALGNASDDSPEEHAFDTVKGSDYLGDQDAIQILCDEAPDDVYQLE